MECCLVRQGGLRRSTSSVSPPGCTLLTQISIDQPLGSPVFFFRLLLQIRGGSPSPPVAPPTSYSPSPRLPFKLQDWNCLLHNPLSALHPSSIHLPCSIFFPSSPLCLHNHPPFIPPSFRLCLHLSLHHLLILLIVPPPSSLTYSSHHSLQRHPSVAPLPPLHIIFFPFYANENLDLKFQSFFLNPFFSSDWFFWKLNHHPRPTELEMLNAKLPGWASYPRVQSRSFWPPPPNRRRQTVSSGLLNVQCGSSTATVFYVLWLY